MISGRETCTSLAKICKEGALLRIVHPWKVQSLCRQAQWTVLLDFMASVLYAAVWQCFLIVLHAPAGLSLWPHNNLWTWQAAQGFHKGFWSGIPVEIPLRITWGKRGQNENNNKRENVFRHPSWCWYHVIVTGAYIHVGLFDWCSPYRTDTAHVQ